MENNFFKGLTKLVICLAVALAVGNVAVFADDFTGVKVGGQLDVNNGNYMIKTFYDAKQEAYDKVATAVKYIKVENKILGEYLYELSAGEVVEIEGGFEATITYNHGRKFLIREFYEPKARAYDAIATQVTAIKTADIINGVDVDTVSEIVESEGKFEAVVVDADGKKYELSEYFSPKAEAYSNLVAQIKAFKNSGTIYGVDVDTVSEIVETTGKVEAVVTDDNGKKYEISEYFSPKAEAYNSLMARVRDIENSGIINGVAVDKVGEIVEVNGKIEAVVTDDDGKEYAISEYFSPKAEAYNSLVAQIKALKSSGTIYGVVVSSVSEIIEGKGKFEAVVTDDNGKEYALIHFFNPADADDIVASL